MFALPCQWVHLQRPPSVLNETVAASRRPTWICHRDCPIPLRGGRSRRAGSRGRAQFPAGWKAARGTRSRYRARPMSLANLDIRQWSCTLVQNFRQMLCNWVVPPSRVVTYLKTWFEDSPHSPAIRPATRSFGSHICSCAGAFIFGAAILRLTGLAFSAPDLQTGQPQALEIPVARIQSFPDRNNLCRVLFFHNDSGRYQDGGAGQCTVPNEMLVWTTHSRAEAFAEAFRSSWKGEPLASLSR